MFDMVPFAAKMREFFWITLLCACLVLYIRVGSCQDVELGGSVDVADQEVRSSEDQAEQKNGKSGVLSGGSRRTPSPSSGNATRDSQLLSVLAARRRQLLHGRLATHINTLASLANKSNRSNTTFAQLEIRDANSSVIKRITLDNSSSKATPTLKLVTIDGVEETKQDIKPHEIRHLFIPKVYQDSRSRAGFLNNRKKESTSAIKNESTSLEIANQSTEAVYVPPEKLEGLDKELELDPEEEFQVDESNHGLYLLNYSDTENVTNNIELNKTINTNETKDTSKIMTSTPVIVSLRMDVTEKSNPENFNISKIDKNTTQILNADATKIDKTSSEKEKENNTLFMSDELYNHFRPLETELNDEEMQPFIYFGQKLGGQSINDNLTNSPSLSASTKAVNFIIAPLETKRKFNSRYSATEKYKNSSVEEEEVNEDMDVSVVKNIIEKNKVRNTVKGPAPGRNVGLVNAYRKHTTASTTKMPNISQLNVTDPIVTSVPTTVNSNKTISASKEIQPRVNTTLSKNDTTSESTAATKNILTRTNSTIPRNYTRTYYNLRRRPAKLTAAPSTDIFPVLILNATTEKSATLVYTAVVTSVSITSSMKGQNKTDEFENGDNSTVAEVTQSKENLTTPKALLGETEISTTGSTIRPYKHRIRIRTTTPETKLSSNPSSPLVYMHRATESPIASELSTRNAGELKVEPTPSKISERLANLFKQPVEDNPMTGSTLKPQNILKRRRPTTTSTTTSATSTTLSTSERITAAYNTPSPASLPPSTYETTEKEDTTENTFMPFVVTSKTSSQSSTKPMIPPNSALNSGLNKTFDNGTHISIEEGNIDEEVVIQAEKTYTASYVLAGLGFLPVAAIVIFVFRNILNKKTKELDTEYEGYFDDGEIKKESPITPVTRAPMPPPTKPDKKWEFPRNKLRLQTLLGQGNFGQVWKAEADDLAGHDGMTRLVAVKSIKETATQKEKQELLHEIFVMQKIGTHPNVVTLLACCTEQEPYLLIMEYVMCGKLLTYLRERRSRPDRFSGSGALTSRDLTVFAYCVARGMDYIASKGIVHRDLAARNVLVDHNKLCKIADFGMSREAAGGEQRARQRHALPVRWMAPEALLYRAHSHEADVWAFGILLWEIVTLGSTPYAAMSGREVLAAVTEGYRLERPPHCKPQLYRAMHSCWHADPSQRPSFAVLKGQLAELLDNEPAEGNYVDLDSFYQESSVYSDPSAIIHDDEGLSAEYDRERKVFRELANSQGKYDNRAFNFRDEDIRNKFGIGTPRMGGFGIRDVPFNDRNFSDGDFNERPFADKNFNERNFTEANFNERKEGKLSTSSFHRERERERDNSLVSRNSFSGFPRIGAREGHFQMMPDGRNKRVSEFECDI